MTGSHAMSPPDRHRHRDGHRRRAARPGDADPRRPGLRRRGAEAMAVGRRAGGALVAALRGAGASDEDLRTTGPQPLVRPARAALRGRQPADGRRRRSTPSAVHRRRRPGRRRPVHAQRRVVLGLRPGRGRGAPAASSPSPTPGPRPRSWPRPRDARSGRSSRSSRVAAAARPAAQGRRGASDGHPVEAGSETLSLRSPRRTSSCRTEAAVLSEDRTEQVGGAGGDGGSQPAAWGRIWGA